jgi:hypothetical protein
MAEARHWRRPLKDGGAEYFFRDGEGQTMRGSGSLPIVADDMQAFFERSTGCALPAPEWKPALYREAAEAKDG